MSTENNLKPNNYLLVLRNKKVNDFADAEALIEGFAPRGYFFDRISYTAFDSPSEIINALKDIKGNYENTIIFCPHVMAKTLKDYVGNLYGSEFIGDRLVKDGDNVFMLFSDGENSVTVKAVCDTLDEKYNLKYNSAYIRAVGVPVSLLNTAIGKAKAVCPELEFNVTAEYGDLAIRIIYGDDIKKSQFDCAYRELLKLLDEYVYAIENIPLAERLIQILKLRRMKICVAESFTGGGIGKRLVEISGASEVFIEALNTYANSSKMQRLGVSELTLNTFGAVSEQTAAEMTEGLLKNENCDIAISTTGIAGPKSDNTKKPVGLAYIGIGLKDEISVKEYNLKGTRKEITETAINIALFSAFKTVKNRRSNI